MKIHCVEYARGCDRNSAFSKMRFDKYDFRESVMRIGCLGQVMVFGALRGGYDITGERVCASNSRAIRGVIHVSSERHYLRG